MANRDTPVLEISDLRVSFSLPGGDFAAVRGVDLTIASHESVAIIGESGSGKSVTASAVMGLVDTPPGRINAAALRFCGADLTSMSARERRSLYGRQMGMVFQDALAHLNPVYSVGWQVAEVCEIHGVPHAEARARAMAMLERVGIPDAARRYDDYPHQFSGGQRQRILIAMAVVMRPALLIADEPTTALDVTVQAQILELLRGLREETGMSLLMITHDLGVAADIADRVVVMDSGEFVEEGPAQDVLTNPRHPYTKKLVAARPKPAAPGEPDAEALPLFEARGLKLYHHSLGTLFGRRPTVTKAVDGVDFTLAPGEVLGVVGESGSGKSSIARMLLLLDYPTEGKVLFRGVDLRDLAGRELRGYRRSVQAVFQDPYTSLNPRMTILQVLCEPWELNPHFLPQQGWRDRAAQLLEQVGLQTADLDKYPSQFSGGQRQRIAIARALTLRPQVVICDEAVSALDMSIRAQVIDLLAELRRELGLAYFFIAHDLKLVENFADRVLVMQQGRIVEQGPVRNVFDAPAHPYTRALIAASPIADPALQRRARTTATTHTTD